MTVIINERPRICCIDVEIKVTEELKKSGFNIYSGTLGDKVRVPNSAIHENHQILLNYDFPPNLHEYDIIIVDLDNYKTVEYKAENYIRSDHTGKSALSLLCTYPETIFDPRPFSCMILNEVLSQVGERKQMMILFTVKSYDIEYQPVKITEGHEQRQGVQRYNIYSLLENPPISKAKFGKEMVVCDIREDLKNLLNQENKIYNQTFYHPTRWKENERVPDTDYVPLIKNSNGDIVSICWLKGNSHILCFPQIKEKSSFLNTFLNKIAVDILPDLFPYSTLFCWKSDKEYWLPGYEILLDEKHAIEKEYEDKLKEKDQEIIQNNQKYSFLHDILTETGDKLVDALVKYLKWIGFRNVIKLDEENTSSPVLEEDIQVQIDEGLLIIECKGIGGTSTDSDCSQISKIKHRRCKERNNFDVYALYIVNHQRYLPPLNRQKIPFTKDQKQDAINDERGLLSTWQLFNLYLEVESGIIDKESARHDFLRYGFIEFKPANIVCIDEPREIFKNGNVCIVDISDVELTVGEVILVEKNGVFCKTTIEGIQLNDEPVSSAKTGEVGLQLSSPIKKKARLWKRLEINKT